MCLKFAKIVTRIPTQHITFEHNNYFKMTEAQTIAHYDRCHEFAVLFTSGEYPVCDFHPAVFDNDWARKLLTEYADNTFDNEDIVDIIASDVDYFIMLKQLEDQSITTLHRLQKQWRNKVDFSKKMKA